MIYEALQILKEQLENYFDEVGLGKNIILDNVALWESGSKDADRLDGKVILTLLKIEEELTLKNSPSVKVVNGKSEYFNPPVNLSLYLLVSANCSSYDISLNSISRTIEFFQGKNIFTSSNTVYNRSNPSFHPIGHFKFVVELFTPGFEVFNHIWGTLGGRQLPSALYKIHIIEITRDQKLAAGELITHISGTLNDIEP